MPAGFLQTSILCVLKVPNSGTSTAPCVTVGIDRYVPVKQTTYVLYPATESAIDAISAPVDYTSLGVLWAFGFSLTLGLWLVAKCAGSVIEAVRRF